jgi:hypothetical protein
MNNRKKEKEGRESVRLITFIKTDVPQYHFQKPAVLSRNNLFIVPKNALK